MPVELQLQVLHTQVRFLPCSIGHVAEWLGGKRFTNTLPPCPSRSRGECMMELQLQERDAP